MRSKLAAGLLLLALSSCGKPSVYSDSAESLAEAEDSASIRVWNPIQDQGDTAAHSAFYDSVLTYVKQATVVEREKREATSLIADRSLLAIDNLASDAKRRVGAQTIDAFVQAIERANADLDAVYSRFYAFLKKQVDTAYRKDTAMRAGILKELARKEVLEPGWRPQLDSLELAIARGTRAILTLVDTNRTSIDFKDGLRFGDAPLAHAYDSLRTGIAGAAAEEAKLVREFRSNAGHPEEKAPDKDTSGRPF